jgi:quinol monooxygenase YgiN
MSVSLLVALAGALVAAAGTGVVAARGLRGPSPAIAALVLVLLGLAISLGAQTLGFATGFNGVTFRAMELGAQVVAPLALVLAMTEIAGQTAAARFAVRLSLAAVGVISLVILATDPLTSATFSKAWPDPATYYQIIPNKLLSYLLLPVTLLGALIAVLVTAARAGREPQWRAARGPVVAAGGAALALCVPGLAGIATRHLGVSVPVRSLFALLCLVAAALAWLAAVAADRLRRDLLRAEAGGAGRDDWDDAASWPGGDARTGQDAGLGYPAATGSGQWDDSGGYPADDEIAEAFGGLYREGRYPVPGPEAHQDPGPYGAYGGDQTARYPHAPEDAGDGYGYPGGEPRYAGDPSGDTDAATRAVPPGSYPAEPAAEPRDWFTPKAAIAGPADGQDGEPQLFGQIAIYTLVEGRTGEFDKLTKRVVRQVRDHEPGTLVYIVHAVPAAPMQRILYEVYRDRDAYEEHRRQPYVQQFEADRRPLVLATNVIELGLQQAKVSPMPSIAKLLSDTGFDLLEDTGFGQPGFAPRGAPGGAGEAPPRAGAPGGFGGPQAGSPGGFGGPQAGSPGWGYGGSATAADSPGVYGGSSSRGKRAVGGDLGNRHGPA